VAHGLERTLAELAEESDTFRQEVATFLEGLVSHYVLDGGRLVVAHAGMKESMQGRGSSAVRDFALFGETTGETDEFGLPVRYPWAEEYRGSARVVYGHTPVPEAEWLNNTLCLDTGCVFGGKLSALRYPEMEIVSVPARAVYFGSVRPLGAPSRSSQQIADDSLDIEDVRGRQHIAIEGFGTIIIPEENAAAALEVMSRFAVDPKWLIYLPPTMSPSETSARPDMLEHPDEAFAYFREQGVAEVVCEEKHMGSRAVAIVARSPGAAQRAFGVETGEAGVIITRTGRRFFDDLPLEAALIRCLADAMESSGLWEELATDWVALDGELMPWSAKAQELLKRQFAPLGAAGRATLQTAVWALAGTDLETRWKERLDAVERYIDAYRRYCRPVDGLEGYQFAPFHILASQGAVHVDKDHVWHMETAARLCAKDPARLLATPFRVVETHNEAQVAAATAWWTDLVQAGGEGMVVKPREWIVRGPKGLVQPALKCRGPEYLRIIYGPEYLQPENLERLRTRAVGRKRSLASREFILGLEAMRRFVQGEPLRRVHQCVFGILALESEPVDPRL
jgi:protein phosphatase